MTQNDVSVTSALAIHDLIVLANRTRAHLADLQSLRAPSDPQPRLTQNIDLAIRAIERVDGQIMRLAISDPNAGWQVFDAIKDTHLGSIQRLSQRLEETLPSRS